MNQTPTPTPTVGHIVHFYESEEYAVAGATKTVDGRIAPKAAMITCVHSEECVNLAVFDCNGVAHSATSILRSSEYIGTSCWMWPPRV